MPDPDDFCPNNDEPALLFSRALKKTFDTSLAFSGSFGYSIESLALARFSVAGGRSASSSAERFLLMGAVDGGCVKEGFGVCCESEDDVRWNIGVALGVAAEEPKTFCDPNAVELFD